MTTAGQITSGLRAALSRPWIYDVLQNLLGGKSARTEYAHDFIRATNGMRVLDLGCGTAQILSFLPAGVDYWGYDVSADYIEAAAARFGARGHFRRGIPDESTIGNMAPFDLAIATGVLHHLDDESARQLLRVARHAVREGGRFVSIDPVFVARQHPVARLLIAKDRGQNVRDPDAYLALAREEFGIVEGTIRHRSWVPYTHWIMECVALPR